MAHATLDYGPSGNIDYQGERGPEQPMVASEAGVQILGHAHLRMAFTNYVKRELIIEDSVPA
ncbi:hypothetical protein PP1Y_Mpl8729 (plasmid) [Novosphingobium sp. PP1Y]|nr:hypothetical protein PP1Y_Mpl8729 [Novosphingobium sp. PP1Y]